MLCRRGRWLPLDLVPSGGPGELAGPLSLCSKWRGRILLVAGQGSCLHPSRAPVEPPKWLSSTGKPIFAMSLLSTRVEIPWWLRL